MTSKRPSSDIFSSIIVVQIKMCCYISLYNSSTRPFFFDKYLASNSRDASKTVKCPLLSQILTFQGLAVSLRISRLNTQKIYVVLDLRWVFWKYLRKDSDFCCIHHNRGGKCLLRGTKSKLRLVSTRLTNIGIGQRITKALQYQLLRISVQLLLWFYMRTHGQPNVD